jgi:nucleoside-diphosphate-sugar epimerase
MNRILIVGGAGYVGGYMVSALHHWGHDVTVYDSLVYENHFLKDVPFIFGDIRDREKLGAILPGFQTVIWLAAIVGDGACAIDPFLTQSINEDSVKWLVDNYNGKIIFTSTCSVYGINNELIDEQAEPNPISTYAKTKLAAELYIREHAKDYLIFRLGTLYGMGDEHARIRLDLVVNVLAKKAACGEKLTVFGGDQWRPLLHVRDVTTAIAWAISNRIQGMFNLSSGNYTIKRIAEIIQEEIPATEVEHVMMQYEDQRNYQVKNDAIVKLGWSPSHNLMGGIRQICNCIAEGRIKNLESTLYSNETYLGANYHGV